MKTFEKLAKRLKKDIGYDLVDFKRTYAGIHMRGSGAFVWTAKIKGTNNLISSTITATELLQKKTPLHLMENAMATQEWEVL
jgi:hypothetical protein